MRLWILSSLQLLLCALVLPILAQDAPRATISPAAGLVEQAVFDIEVAGLEPDTRYSIAIVFGGEVVFSSQETSDAAGEISYSISSTAGDPAGIYTLQLLSGDEVLASADFELTAADQSREQDEVEDSHGNVSVMPATVPFGKLQTLRVTELQAETAYSVEISNSETAQLVYRRQQNSDENGVIELEIFAQEGDAPGRHSIAVYDSEGGLIAEGEFTIEAPPERAISLDVRPAWIEAGAEVEIAVSGLPAFASVTAQLTSDAGVLIDTVSARASSQGEVTLSFLTADDLGNGAYIVDIFVEGIKSASADFVVGEAASNQLETVVTIEPASTAEIEEDRSSPASQAVTSSEPPPAPTGASVGLDQVIEGRLQDGSALIEFAAEAGQYLLIAVSSDDFEPTIAIYDRDQLKIAHADNTRSGREARIGPLQLPYSGEYQLEISASAGLAEQVNIQGDFVARVAQVQVASPSFDSELPFALEAGASALYYALPLETGDRLSISSDSDGSLDTLLQVLAPDGSEYAFDDDSGPGFDAELNQLLFERAGTYILTLSSFDGAASGSGSLSIVREPVHRLEAGETVVTLNDKAFRDFLVFDAQKDELLILNLDKLYGDVEDLFVTATVEGMEVMAYSTMGVPDQLPLAFVMPMSGARVADAGEGRPG